MNVPKSCWACVPRRWVLRVRRVCHKPSCQESCFKRDTLDAGLPEIQYVVGKTLVQLVLLS